MCTELKPKVTLASGPGGWIKARHSTALSKKGGLALLHPPGPGEPYSVVKQPSRGVTWLLPGDASPAGSPVQ